MITLYQFPHSHFSEKVRWALRYKGLDFEVVNLPRGPHEKFAQERGLPDTSVPIIKDGDKILQGSSAIISYLDKTYPARSLTPSDPDVARDILEFETQMDFALGHHGRRYVYSIFLKHPQLIKDLFLGHANPLLRLAFPLLFPAIKTKIANKLELTPDATAESREILQGGLNQLNRRLEDRAFVFGNSLTRADISAAALTSIFTWPDEHDFNYAAFGPPPEEMTVFRDDLKSQPFFNWALELYRNYR